MRVIDQSEVNEASRVVFKREWFFLLRDWNYKKNALFLKTGEVMGTTVQRVSFDDGCKHDEKLHNSFRHKTRT